MGGRRFGQRNAAPPECVDRMAEQTPACFDRKIWRLYVDDCWRASLNDDAERARMSRGVLPDYCEDCTRGHQLRMLAAGRCNPPSKAVPPDAPQRLTLEVFA